GGVCQCGTKQFTRRARDQFGQPLATPPTFAWSVAGAGGAVNQAGLYTAPASGTPTETVRATAGGVTGTATVTVTPRTTTGRGLRGTYYNNKDLTAPVLTR